MALSLLSSAPTNLGPLTATFTAPPQCWLKTAWVEPINEIPHQFYTGGVANDKWLLPEFQRTECFPSNYPATEAGGFQHTKVKEPWPLTEGFLGPYFSPGLACPAGWTTATTEELPVATQTITGISEVTTMLSETRAICCPSSLSFNATHGCFYRQETKPYGATRFADEYFVHHFPEPTQEAITTKKMKNWDPDFLASVIELRWQASDLEALAAAVVTHIDPLPTPGGHIISSGQSVKVPGMTGSRTGNEAAAVESNSIFSSANTVLSDNVNLRFKIAALLGVLLVIMCL